MPLVCSYYAVSADPFLNYSIQNATHLEWAGNALLSPIHYLLAGSEAVQQTDGSWEFTQRFDYNQGFWVKTTTSVLAAPASLVLGSFVKGLSLLEPSTRARFFSLREALQSTQIISHLEAYKKMGLEIEALNEYLIPEGHQRRPGDEQTLSCEKQALRDISALLNQAKIPWWVDCGTCLGAYRYGGVIPWDEDIDIAVLLPDFHNVKKALNQLDPKKYLVQDWSSRESPNSFLKVYIRENGKLIDIYHFAIHPKTKQLEYIFSLESNCFFPEWWKIRERRFKVPTDFQSVFPLKKAFFDGIEVFVPRETKKYLQRCYGENLAPAKIYDPLTDQYIKDLTHSYWQSAYVH